MGYLPNPFKSTRVREAEQWLEEAYPSYPKGVKRVRKRRRDDQITVTLEEPLDPDIFSSTLRDAGLEPDINQADDGHQIINAYNVVEYGEEKTGRRLQSVFHEEKSIPIATDPLTSNGSPHPRLRYIADYLDRKYE